MIFSQHKPRWKHALLRLLFLFGLLALSSWGHTDAKTKTEHLSDRYEAPRPVTLKPTKTSFHNLASKGVFLCVIVAWGCWMVLDYRTAIPANQGKFDGPYSVEVAQAYLTNCLKKIEDGNYMFSYGEHETHKLNGDLKGGVCSVKTQLFLRIFFAFLNKHNKYYREEQEGMEIQCSKDYSKDMCRFFGDHLTGCDENLRAMQAVLNTITVVKQEKPLELKAIRREKVRALLVAPFILDAKKVGHPLWEGPLDLKNKEENPGSFSFRDQEFATEPTQRLEALSGGVYFLRFLLEGSEGEIHGHSAALVVGHNAEKGKTFMFFDPNFAIFPWEKTTTAHIIKGCKRVNRMFTMTTLDIYRIEIPTFSSSV